MKLFGTIAELLQAKFKKNSQDVTLRPNQSTTYTAARDIQLPEGDTAHVIVSRTSADTLTNKTLTSPIVGGTPTINGSLVPGTDNAVSLGDSTHAYVATWTRADKLNGSTSGTLTMTVPATVTSHTLTLPSAQGGASTVLTNDGSGGLSWASAASSTLTQYNTDIGNSSNSRTATNTALLGRIAAKTQTATVTMTIATPAVVTWTSHGLTSGDTIYFTTTGALPTGVSASTTYYVTTVDANTFKLSTTIANYIAGTFVASSGSQSGTHTGTAGGFAPVAGTIMGGDLAATLTGLKTFSTGIALPTSGGTAGTLDFYGVTTYQNGGTTLTFKHDDGTALSSDPATYKLTFRRVGNTVTVQMAFASLTFGKSASLKINGYAAAFQPSTSQYTMVPFMSGATSGISAALVGSSFFIYKDAAGTNFANTNTLATPGNPVTFTYSVD